MLKRLTLHYAGEFLNHALFRIRILYSNIGKKASKIRKKLIANSMQYYESSQSISNTSQLHRYFEIPIDPADAMKEGTLRLYCGDGTLLAATGDERKVTLGNAMYLYAKR